MAAMLGEPPSTVQSWKAARRIPAHKQREVIEKAGLAGVSLSADDVVWPMGRTEDASPAICTTCDHRLDDVAIRACSVRDCPNAQQEAA